MLHRLRALFAIDPSVSRSRIARECSVRKQSISLYLRGMFRGKQDTLEKKISVLIANYFQPLQVNQRAARRQEEWAKIVPPASSTSSTTGDATNAAPNASNKGGPGIIAALTNAATNTSAGPHVVPLAPSTAKGREAKGKESATATPTGINASKSSGTPNATVAPVVAPPRPLSRKEVLMQADIDYHTRNRTLYANDGPAAGMRKASRRMVESNDDDVMTEEESTTNEDKKEDEEESIHEKQQLEQSALRRSVRRPRPPQECLPPSKRARAE